MLLLATLWLPLLLPALLLIPLLLSQQLLLLHLLVCCMRLGNAAHIMPGMRIKRAEDTITAAFGVI